MDTETRAKAVERDGRSGFVLDDMSVIKQLTETLRTSVEDADPSGGVGRMMCCSWFGELTLAFPKPETIRIPLVPDDDKTELTGSFRLQFTLLF